jgi:hypothetical protein
LELRALRYSAAVYIGLGTLVLIIIIVAIVLLVRR